MSKKIQLSRVLLEAVVIVGSILLAFGIDAWWDGVQDRRAEQASPWLSAGPEDGVFLLACSSDASPYRQRRRRRRRRPDCAHGPRKHRTPKSEVFFLARFGPGSCIGLWQA